MGNYGFYAKHHYLGDGDRYPGDALIDAANEAIDLQAENERLRAELRVVTERSEAMKARCKEAVALWRDENKQLRNALGAILDGLTDALGNPMGARPSQVTTLYSIASHALRPTSKEDGRG